MERQREEALMLYIRCLLSASKKEMNERKKKEGEMSKKKESLFFKQKKITYSIDNKIFQKSTNY